MKIIWRSRLFIFLSLFLALTTIIVTNACNNSQRPSKKILKVGLSRGGEINTLNPTLASNATTITLVWYLYSRICDINDQGEVIPMVSAKWKHTDNLKTWRFTIRDDIHFYSKEISFKRLVMPEDVKASIEYSVSKPGLGRSLLGDLIIGIDEFIEKKTENIKGIKVEGKDVIFQLTRPFEFLPQRLATSFFSILPKEHIDKIEKGSVIGSGPFLLESFDKTTQKVILSWNPSFWDQSVVPIAEQIEIFWMLNEGSLVSEFRAGNLDWVELSPKITPQVPEGKKETQFKTLNIALVAFNMNRQQRLNTSFRVYLDLISDRTSIANFFPGSVPVNGPFPPMILAQYGIVDSIREEEYAKPKNIKPLELLIMPMEPYKTIGQLLARQWQSKGINVKPILGQADFIKRLAEGEFDLALAYFGPLAASAEQYTWPYLSFLKPLPNASGYSSDKIDAAYNILTSNLDENVQRVALQDIIYTAKNDMPYLPLLQLSFRVWHSKEIKPRGMINGIISFLEQNPK